jgi:hypothetical protein
MIGIRIQHFRLNTDTDKKIKKMFDQNYNLQYLSLGLHKGRPGYRRHPALQKMKFLNIFLLLWVIFAILDLDSEYGSGSETLPATLLNQR